jgi:histidine triad (HIT) family protein
VDLRLGQFSRSEGLEEPARCSQRIDRPQDLPLKRTAARLRLQPPLSGALARRSREKRRSRADLMPEDLCLLCRIARGELEAKTVWATKRAVAVMNTREPHAGGHVVIFPRRHAVALHEMNPEDVAEVIDVVRRIARALRLDNYNVLHNAGALAGQTVFHAHFHLIPKWSEAEGLRYAREAVSGIDQEEWYRRVKEALSSAG